MEVFVLGVEKADLHRLVDVLRDSDQNVVYEFMRYIVDKYKDPYYEIKLKEPDDIPLNEEELAQFKDTEFVSWEEAKRDLEV
jgi:hypothetical protein